VSNKTKIFFTATSDRPWWQLIFGDCALASVVLISVVFSPLSTVVGSPMVDVWNHMWGSWWWFDALSQGMLPWETTLLQYPDGGTLWFIDPVLAILGLPFAGFSPTLAYNIGIWIYLAFASWTARRFAISLGSAPSSSWIASITVVCSAWMLSEISNGITEAVNIGPVALAMAWTEDACRGQNDKQSPMLWLKAGLGVGLATMASPYLGLGVGVVVAVRTLTSFHQTWKWSWLGGLTSIVVASPTLLLFRVQLEATNAIIKRPDGMNDSLALHNAVDPRTFIAPFGFQSVDLTDEGFVHSMYLGIFALFFAVRAIKDHKGWAFAGVISMLCALGPYLYWGDGWVMTSGARLRLPWFMLQQMASGLAVTHPLRLGVPTLAIVGGFAAVSLTTPYWLDRIRTIGILIAIDGLLISGAPFPLSTASSTIPGVYELVEQDPRDVGVLDLPTDSGSNMMASKYLYWQSYHNKGIPYAPDVRASTSSLLNNTAFRRLAALCTRRADEHQRLGLHNRSPGSTDPRTLSSQGYGWIVLHKNIDPTVYQQLLEVLQADLGAGLTIDDATIWRLETQSPAAPKPTSPQYPTKRQ